MPLRAANFPRVHARPSRSSKRIAPGEIPVIIDTIRSWPEKGCAALKIARQMQAKRRKLTWPKICICGEYHRLLFTTATGQPIKPRNISAVHRPIRHGTGAFLPTSPRHTGRAATPSNSATVNYQRSSAGWCHDLTWHLITGLIDLARPPRAVRPSHWN